MPPFKHELSNQAEHASFEYCLPMTDLSIILVNWNCIAFTEQCIDSICATASGLNYEVVVVDNDSADAPCKALVEKFPWIKLVLSEQNIGFGRANNLGV